MMHLFLADDEQYRGCYAIGLSVNGMGAAAAGEENEFDVAVMLMRCCCANIFPELRDFEVLIAVNFCFYVDYVHSFRLIYERIPYWYYIDQGNQGAPLQ